jgi:hypothetical protein
MPNSQAIVWMDSCEASVWRFGSADVEQRRLRSDAPFLKINHKAGTMGAGRPLADNDFFDHVIDALRGIGVWSLAGPDTTRDQFLGYLEHYKARDGHIARLLVQLAGITEMARPTDSALDEQARSRAAA